ncbi:STAS domain-containing protein [Aliiroseovarius subalbicans]|uniref:STAS domain-containing protein n=1 Tax=Aliiroseovarius subalbicans TaxID=2925840 RepID=UPI001F56A881|nr:STAS domain-containing protein [Aliiroseovarius subalbicans]MCI2400200.1 STAS domain-containing protein [Aliiroseovarius subalbicans]
MQLDYHDTANVRTITVHEDRVDAAVAITFKDKMRDLCEDGPDRVILDLSQVMFIDSSGLGAVVASMKQASGKALELAGLSPTVLKVFRLTRMDSVFVIHESAAAALGGGLANAS